MSQMPPTDFNASPAAAPQRKFPVWAIVVIALVVLCLCAACISGVLLMNSPMGTGAMAGGQLPFECMERTSLGSEVCGEWAQGVANNPEFNTCVTDLLTENNLNSDSLYDCLVEAGVGP